MREVFSKWQKYNGANRYFIILLTIMLFLSGAVFGQATNATPPPFGSPNPAVSATPPNKINPSAPASLQTVGTAPLSRAQAVQMTLQQVSIYNRTQLNERIAEGDILQSKAALYPRVTSNPTLIYTSPALTDANPNGIPHPPSFLGANAISEYQGLVTASGEIDISGRLRATVRRNQALLEAARSGTEAARRTLIENLDEAYLNLALAETKRWRRRKICT